ncbi:RDD family protein [Dyadobacter sp.]|uniref:RDD family protein n=1 Tax=Dyadobacter sp. TaxID=1914288 RepID=UPI0025B88BD8|nr:RDD family protein [Dyadobacter sp.]
MTTISTNSPISTGTRLGSMLMDYVFTIMIVMVFAVPGMVSTFSNAFEVTHEQESFDFMGGSFFYIYLIGFALYFCKDGINGRSFAKRILNLQVVDNETGLAASPMKCFVRNLPLVLWPVEAIIALSNTSRRLGDRIAGTRLEVFDKTVEQPKVNFGQVLVPVLISYGLMLLLTLPFTALTSATERQKVNYIEASYNAQSSKEAEKLFADSLGQYLTASVRAYDQIRDKPLKYVSVIFQLNENYLGNDQNFGEIKSITMPILLSKFPEKAFIGQIKYVYRTSNSMQTRIERLNWPQK